jgi:hypothetical protein
MQRDYFEIINKPYYSNSSLVCFNLQSCDSASKLPAELERRVVKDAGSVNKQEFLLEFKQLNVKSPRAE